MEWFWFDHLQRPWWLVLTGILPLLLWLFYRMEKMQASAPFSSLSSFRGIPKSPRQMLRGLLPYVKLLALALMIFALSGPSSKLMKSPQQQEGLDIVLAVDVSGSMEALDLLSEKEIQEVMKKNPEDFFDSGEAFGVSRLGYAKGVIQEFIASRLTDRLALVAFAGEAKTLAPLTTDYSALSTVVQDLHYPMVVGGQEYSGSVAEKGTAAGDALMASINRLFSKGEYSQSQIIILLTDGQSNRGFEILRAARVAQARGIKIYSIGLGRTQGEILRVSRNKTVFGLLGLGGLKWKKEQAPKALALDEEVLKKISLQSGGEYFHANDARALSDIYQAIGSLEKVSFDKQSLVQFKPKFWAYLLLGLILYILAEVFGRFFFRVVPQ